MRFLSELVYGLLGDPLVCIDLPQGTKRRKNPRFRPCTVGSGGCCSCYPQTIRMLLVAHMCETTNWKREIGDRNLLIPREAIVESNEQPDFVYAVIPSSCYAKEMSEKTRPCKMGKNWSGFRIRVRTCFFAPRLQCP